MALTSFFKVTFVTLGIIALVFAIVLPALVQAEDPIPYSGFRIGVCENLSKTWHGRCRSTGNCDKHCRVQEQAAHGACHGFWHGKCYCYVAC